MGSGLRPAQPQPSPKKPHRRRQQLDWGRCGGIAGNEDPLRSAAACGPCSIRQTTQLFLHEGMEDGWPSRP
jgi:hypothetical protein